MIEQTIQKLTTTLIVNKKKIIKFYWAVVIIGLLFLVGSYIYQPLEIYWLPIGTKSGTLAVICFSIAVYPGIARRFGLTGIFQKLQVLIMTFRRQVGIAFYLFATAHYCWVRFFDVLKYHFSIIPKMTFEIFGLTAFLLSMPLFITSNDYSQTKLGSLWKKIHSLVYIIPWFIFIHLALNKPFESSTIIIAVTALAVVFSWIVYWRRNRQSITIE